MRSPNRRLRRRIGELGDCLRQLGLTYWGLCAPAVFLNLPTVPWLLAGGAVCLCLGWGLRRLADWSLR